MGRLLRHVMNARSTTTISKKNRCRFRVCDFNFDKLAGSPFQMCTMSMERLLFSCGPDRASLRTQFRLPLNVILWPHQYPLSRGLSEISPIISMKVEKMGHKLERSVISLALSEFANIRLIWGCHSRIIIIFFRCVDTVHASHSICFVLHSFLC